MGFANPSRLRAQTLTLWPCEDARQEPNTMLRRPKDPDNFRFSSQLNYGSTQFNAYQNSFFEKGEILVENEAKMANLPRLILEAYGELSLESRQYVKYRPRRTSWTA